MKSQLATTAVLWIALAPAAFGQNADRFVQSRFDRYDKNSDVKITPDEAPNRLIVRVFDRDNNGSLSLTEFKAVVERATGQRGQSKGARQNDSTTSLRNR